MLCNAILSFLLGDAMKVAHSLPFELEWTLCIYGDRFRPLTTDGYGDTMVQAYVLDERRDGLDLSMLTMQHFGFDLKRQLDVDRNNLAKLPVDRLLRYNALDAKYTARVYMRQHARLQRENLLDVYRFQLGRVLSLVRAQEVGIPVDLDSAAKFHARLTGEINDVLQRIRSSREARQYQERTGCVLLPTSSDQLTVLLRDVLRRSEGQRVSNRSGYSTDDSVLSRIDLPVTRDILELRNRLKLKSTYIDPIVSSVGLVYPDGRLHTKFNDLFTTTGRLSSDGPNMQNFPKRKDVWVRALVVAPPGQVLVACDYGQQEYRVLAIASGDKRLLSSIRDGYDVHMDWAERVARADDRVYRAYGKDMKRLRSDIKNTWVFPAFYGAQADYIARMLSMNVQAARKLFDVFWEEFEGVLLWQQRVLRRYIEVGYVECLTGRRRRAPLNNNMVYNSPIQGTASDIVIDAMTRLDKLAEHSNEPALRAVLNIHDDLTFLVPERCQEEVCDIIVREMLESSFDWITVPLSVEVSVGRNWADCNKVGVFTK
jgi:DNA polymerase I